MRNERINTRFFCIFDRFMRLKIVKFTFFGWIGARFGARFSVKSGKKRSHPAFCRAASLFMKRIQQGSFARVGTCRGNVCRRVQPVFPAVTHPYVNNVGMNVLLAGG